MRKLLLLVTASCAVLAFAPATALAHRHHHHRRHHARIHHRTFGSDLGTPTTSTASPQSAGKVQTFTNGVLTIALNDGTTVSGKVTPFTEIECQAAQPTGMDRNFGDSGDQSQSGGDQSQGDDQGQGDDDQGDDDQGEQQGGSQACMAALVQNAPVQEAELSVSSAGAVWRNIDLVTDSSPSSGSDSGSHQGD
jgi:hypothetical protein